MSDTPRDPVDPGARILDFSVIETLRELGGDDEPDLLQELVEVFLEDAPNRIRDMHTALASGDLLLLERAAHTLKSSAANLGALTLSDHAHQLEQAVWDGQEGRCSALVSGCKAACDDATQALRDLVARGV